MCFRNAFLTLFIMISAVGLLAGCGLKQSLPVVENPPACRTYEIGAGPEDFVLDTGSGPPRLLVSCHDRRPPGGAGKIMGFDLATRTCAEMKRRGDKEAISHFAPHGMDIRHTAAGKTLLYVIVHDFRGRGDRFENAIAVYEVGEDTLELAALLQNKACLWSPNDLSVMASGEIYVTNDYRTEMDLYLKREASEIAHYDPEKRSWRIVADDLRFANGILAETGRVFIAATLGNTLYAFSRNPDGSLGEPEIIAEIKGLDNIMAGESGLFVAAHFDDLAFMRHRKTAGEPSPTALFCVDPVRKTKEVLYADDGRNYSAASTVLVYDGVLYAGQVFDDLLLVCGE